MLVAQGVRPTAGASPRGCFRFRHEHCGRSVDGTGDPAVGLRPAPSRVWGREPSPMAIRAPPDRGREERPRFAVAIPWGSLMLETVATADRSPEAPTPTAQSGLARRILVGSAVALLVMVMTSPLRPSHLGTPSRSFGIRRNFATPRIAFKAHDMASRVSWSAGVQAICLGNPPGRRGRREGRASGLLPAVRPGRPAVGPGQTGPGTTPSVVPLRC